MTTMETGEWFFRKRDYVFERSKLRSDLVPTSEHPLRGTIVNVIKTSNIRSGEKDQDSSSKLTEDPLSMFSSASSGSHLDGTDPLSMLARGEDVSSIPSFGRKRLESSKKFGDIEGYIDDTFEPWSSKRAAILSKYTTSAKLTITTSFLTAEVKERAGFKQSTITTTSDKLKNRLEEIDDMEEGSVKQTLNLSQTEYVNRIEQLNSTLLEAWKSEQKVKSLKIAIQCAKLLGDTDVLQFYPSKFVLITDILDNFGKLVFKRILDKSVTYVAGSNAAIPLKENFSPEEVPDSAKETCRNWFYKIASIRELIPRLFVEMAILQCYSFLTTGEYSQALLRLINQIRGIADPLVAIYARAYLCRVGIVVAPKVRDHLNPCWFDYLASYNQINQPLVQDELTKQCLDMPTYLQLFPPALDWLLQCIAYKGTENVLSDILEKHKTCNSALILNSILRAFDPKFVASRALQFNELIKECQESGLPKYLLYKGLGECVVVEDPPEDSKLTLLNEVWKVVVKLKSPLEYMNCAEVWIEYPLKYFTSHEVNTLLGNINKHMQPDRSFEDHYPKLLSVLTKVVSLSEDFKTVFAMDNFLPFFDMFQKESIKVEACKSIMAAYNKTEEELSDPVLINSLMAICRTLHDSVSAISLDDERREVTQLISQFLYTVSFGRDFERQLHFYVDARAIFSNLDPILVTLVQSVNLLTNKTKQVVKGNHSRKTASFVRACMAYCFITIPSLTDIYTRLKLYFLSAQTALANQAMGQADALFRAAITLLPDFPKTIESDHKNRSSELFLVEYINNLLSALLIVPDHPDHDVLYLFRGLLNVIENYPWDENNDAKIRLYLNTVCILSAACQDAYIYQVYKVDSNDKLYGSGEKFHGEVLKIIEPLVKDIYEELKKTDSKNLKNQAFLALAFLNRMLCHANMDSPVMVKLADVLWRLAAKNDKADKNMMSRLKQTIEKRSQVSPGYKEILRTINSRGK